MQRRYEEHFFAGGPSLSEALEASGAGTGEDGQKEGRRRLFQGTRSKYGDGTSSFRLWPCRWYDVSCWLRVLFTGSAYGGSREPAYDVNSYPSGEGSFVFLPPIVVRSFVPLRARYFCSLPCVYVRALVRPIDRSIG